MLIDGLHGYLCVDFIMTYWNFTVTYAYQKVRNYAAFGASVIKIPFNILKSKKVVLSNKCLRQRQRFERFFPFSGRKLLHCRKESGIVTADGDCFLRLRGALLVPL